MTGNRITEIFAWVTLDDGDGNEGILGFLTPAGMWMPMIGADRARIESLREKAQAMAGEHPHPVELRRFSAMTVEQALAPPGPARARVAERVTCPSCGGDGGDFDDSTKDCDECDGKGWVESRA